MKWPPVSAAESHRSEVLRGVRYPSPARRREYLGRAGICGPGAFFDRSSGSAQVRVPGQHVARAADAVERDHRLLGGSGRRMFGELNDKQEEYLKAIYASGQHLLSLINDILDLSKIEAGRIELVPPPFHLPTALENTLILVRERAGRRGITLGHSVDERLGSIRGDERKVKQVLLNLLSNALKFTARGGRS